ncbi:hypothetical protein [Streptomyces sp. NPDC001389]|uniref:hypothetical protein n=1 Tax=unclassified Streptomyces TaxID=2593676 RepID=UPI0036BE46E8
MGAGPLVKDRLTLQGGLAVSGVLETQDGPPRLVVHGRVEARSDLAVGGALSAVAGLAVSGQALFEGRVNANGHLSVRGPGGWVMHTDDDKVSLNSDLRVQGESAFHGKVNANAHLSVRGGGAWVVHTNDGQVSVNGDLRVHGAFRSDS